MDGWITIGTKLDTDEFDEEFYRVSKRLLEIEKEEMEVDVSIKGANDTIAKMDELEQKSKNLNAELKQLEDNQISSPIGMDEFIAKQEELKAEIADTNAKIQEMGPDYNQALSNLTLLNAKQEALTNETTELGGEMRKLGLEKALRDLDEAHGKTGQLASGFNGVKNTIQNSVRSLKGFILSLISIRAAISALRSASSQLASYDPQYKANLDYIRYALTQAIAPVLRWIISTVATILGYINAIAQAWFSINLFGNASAKSFQSMNASAGGAAASVAQMKKDLAGFDEMNVLSDQSSGGGRRRRRRRWWSRTRI